MICEMVSIVDNGKKYLSEEIRSIIYSISRAISRISNIYGKDSEKRIALYLDRDVMLYCSVIAILECGYTFIPLDLEWPDERRDFIVKDCECDIILTKEKYKHKFSLPSICVDTLDLNFSEEGCFADSPRNIPPENIAYIMYTSGTTGTPKGVAISYGAVQSFLEDVGEPAHFHEKMTLLSFSKPVFDMFLSECLPPFYYGGTIIIADYSAFSYRKVYRQIMDWDVDSTIITPSRFQLLLDILGEEKSNDVLTRLRKVYFGGENIPINLLQRLQKYKIEVLNLYGPTETTILSTVADLTNSVTVHVGKPLRRTHVVVRDPDDNGTGEIWISGPSLANGYINNPSLSEDKFVTENGIKYYKTADLGFINSEGNLVLRGRIDNQIKFNGYRIELEEIERVAERLDMISWATAFVSCLNRLVLIYHSQVYIQRETLLDHLMKYLPHYMVPSEYINLNELSLNSSGKINKREFIEMYNQNIRKEKLEKDILKMIKESFSQEVDAESSLKSLDSISFIQLLVNIEERYNFEFPDEMLNYEKLDTVKKIAEYLVFKDIDK